MVVEVVVVVGDTVGVVNVDGTVEFGFDRIRVVEVSGAGGGLALSGAAPL